MYVSHMPGVLRGLVQREENGSSVGAQTEKHCHVGPRPGSQLDRRQAGSNRGHGGPGGLKASLTFGDAADHFAVKHLAVLIEDEPRDTEQGMRLRGVAGTDASGN